MQNELSIEKKRSKGRPINWGQGCHIVKAEIRIYNLIVFLYIKQKAISPGFVIPLIPIF